MYKISTIDEIIFSPGCEQGADFCNFYDSLKIVYRISELFQDVF